MRVLIRAHSSFQVPYLWKDGRPFPTSGHKEIEVVKDIPPQITRMVPNPSGGQHRVTVSDPDRMGMAEYYRIVGDGKDIPADTRFSVMESGGVDATLSSARVQAALAEVEKRDRIIADQTVQLAGKDAEIKQLQEMLAAAGGGDGSASGGDGGGAAAGGEGTNEKPTEKTGGKGKKGGGASS